MRAAVKPRIGLWIRRWWTLFLLPAGLLLIWLAHSFPAVTEQVYSRIIYPLMAGSIGALTSLFPFSLFEIGAAGCCCAVAVIWDGVSAACIAAPSRAGARRMEAPADTAAESRMRHFFHICYDLWTELPSFGICTDKRSANP